MSRPCRSRYGGHRFVPFSVTRIHLKMPFAIRLCRVAHYFSQLNIEAAHLWVPNWANKTLAIDASSERDHKTSYIRAHSTHTHIHITIWTNKKYKKECEMEVCLDGYTTTTYECVHKVWICLDMLWTGIACMNLNKRIFNIFFSASSSASSISSLLTRNAREKKTIVKWTRTIWEMKMPPSAWSRVHIAHGCGFHLLHEMCGVGRQRMGQINGKSVSSTTMSMATMKRNEFFHYLTWIIGTTVSVRWYKPNTLSAEVLS